MYSQACVIHYVHRRKGGHDGLVNIKCIIFIGHMFLIGGVVGAWSDGGEGRGGVR